MFSAFHAVRSMCITQSMTVRFVSVQFGSENAIF